VAPSNPVTGGVDVEEIVRLVDKDTCLLNVIYASNISGAKLDMAEIVRRARAIKPDLYIVVDAVQHAPHGLIDLQKTPVDGINLAPYKFFGCRGSGLSWVSERAAVLPHHKLAGKKPDFWDLGSSAPWQFAVLTEIVDYVCWLGGQFTGATDATPDRRALFVAGIGHIELHERALLAALLDGNRQRHRAARDARRRSVPRPRRPDPARPDPGHRLRAHRLHAGGGRVRQARRHGVRARGDQHLFEAHARVLRPRRHGARVAAALQLDGRHGEVPAVTQEIATAV
jgi:hypothetical protein